MTLVMTSGPASEPVTLAEAKAHLRIDGTAEDVYLGSLILTSRLQIEAALGLALMRQRWQLTLDAWPATATVVLPLHPVRTLDAVTVTERSGAIHPVDIALFRLLAGQPDRVVPTAGIWPSTADMTITVDFTVGYGPTPADVPAPIRHALLLLVAHWYEHRDPYDTTLPRAAIPAIVSELLMPYRGPRL